MSNFNIGLQEAKGGYRVVLYSDNNGKLVLAGETISKKQDAEATLASIKEAWNDKRDTLILCDMIIPKGHKWPGNAGPKKAAKKRAAKKAGHVTNPIRVKTKKPVKLGYMPGVGYVTSKKAKKR